ncbi:hypothetical protein MCUN1_000920 [Malassezia cuniculi]|uniref:BHLH domain-containing protein n=1 Tax=Malassezia cuniculi TaxID=948313 RepID=A0AAF0EWR0_9BASI|nr:hypothetical protein MCUN1_000920 [Malassezia cuniculi]
MDWRAPPYMAGGVPDMLSSKQTWNATQMPKASGELPDLFLTNILEDDALMAGMASDISGSTGSDSEGSPASFQDFMLGASLPGDILSMQPVQPLGVEPSFSTYENDTPLFGKQSEIIAAPHFDVQTANPAALSIGKPDFFIPLADMNTNGAQKATVDMAELKSSPSAETNPQPSGSGTIDPKIDLPFFEAGSHADARSVLETLRVHTKQMSAAPAPLKPKVENGQQKKTPAPSTGKEDEPVSKKVAHNAIERRYRSNINDRIAGLRDVVPALRELRPAPRGRKRRRKGAVEEEIVDGVSAATKLNKATVLSKATEYILYLKSRETRLAREVNGLQMLVRSLKGGEELLALWTAEMARIDEQTAKETVAVKSPPEDDADDMDSDEESQASSESSLPQPAYLFGAFVGFSLLGGASKWEESHNSFVPPSHTRVIGATHQLVKRAASNSEWDAHHLDHVPVHQLVLELLRTAALILCVVFILLGLYKWAARPRRNVAEAIHTSILVDHDESAVEEYRRLQQAVGAPTSVVGCIVSLVSYEKHDAVRARALLRLVEMDISAPPHLRAPWLQRMVNLFAARRAQNTTSKVAAVLALGYEALAENATFSGHFHKEAMKLWASARIQVQKDDSPSPVTSWLARTLALPLEQAYTYAVQAPCDETHPAASPLNTIVDALRQEELLAFWSALLSSMMRNRGARASLDIVEDRASVDALRKHLAVAAELTPYRTEAIDEQALVARGILALVTGQMSLAAACARMLSSDSVTRAASLFVSLVQDTEPVIAEEPQGPLDVLSSTTLAWLRLQRDVARGASTKLAPELQRLASTTLWMLVGTDQVEVKRSVSSPFGSLFHTCTSRPVQGTAQLQVQPLTNSLDTLMDLLAEHL